MGSTPVNLFRWLDHHSDAILFAGAAAALAANILAYQNDRKAARRLKSAAARPALQASLPLVSFLVPAWNEAKHVQACICSILALRYPHKELILCAGGRDATLAICRRFAGDGVIVLEQMPGEGKQGALRRCFEQSTGEILFLTDADCIVGDYCVENTLAPLLLDRENVVTGYWQPFEQDKSHPFVDYQWAQHLRYQAGMPDWTETLDGRNSAVRRPALEAAGGFRNEASIGTDYVLSKKLAAAGFRIRSIPASRVQTEYQANIPAYLRQNSRWYRNRLVQGIRYGQWRDVALSLWGAGASLFMLAGAFALPLRWRAVRSAWLAGLLHLLLSQARMLGFLRLSGYGEERGYLDLLRFTGYTLLIDLAMIKGFLASLDRRGRKTW